MKRSKLLFLVSAILFFVLLFYASYDIASRTTFPGSKPQLQERIKDRFSGSDTVRNDTLRKLLPVDTLQ